MELNEKEIKKFYAVKSLAKERLRTMQVDTEAYDMISLQRQINKTGLEDCQALLRIMQKEVMFYNSKIKSRITLIEKLSPLKKNIRSHLFEGLEIPFETIDKLIELHPDKDYFDIYYMARNTSNL